MLPGRRWRAFPIQGDLASPRGLRFFLYVLQRRVRSTDWAVEILPYNRPHGEAGPPGDRARRRGGPGHGFDFAVTSSRAPAKPLRRNESNKNVSHSFADPCPPAPLSSLYSAAFCSGFLWREPALLDLPRANSPGCLVRLGNALPRAGNEMGFQLGSGSSRDRKIIFAK